MTVLEHAVLRTKVESVRVLLSRGARIDVDHSPLLLVCGQRMLCMHKMNPDYEQIGEYLFF